MESTIFNGTLDSVSLGAGQSIPALFGQIASLYPDKPALGSTIWEPAYGELNATANQLAHRLIAGGHSTGERAVIFMQHDAPLVGVMLGILKAGMIFVVLNPGDPAARLAYLLGDIEPSTIVTDTQHRPLAEKFATSKTQLICFGEQADFPAHEPGIGIPPSAAACLIYTSGSTGRPKGVIQTHRNIIHNVSRLSRGLEITSGDRITLFASPSGGQGLSTVWCALLNGAALCPFRGRRKGNGRNAGVAAQGAHLRVDRQRVAIPQFL